MNNLSAAQIKEIRQIPFPNADPATNRILKILKMRADGAMLKEIAFDVKRSINYVAKILQTYTNEGLDAVIGNDNQEKHRKPLSYEEEREILAPFFERMHRGELVNTKEIAAAYRAAVPYPVSESKIYTVLHRHGWRRGSLRNSLDI